MNFLHRAWAEIDTSALLHNFEIIKSSAEGSKLIAVVKANAYGHSVKNVSLLLDKAGVYGFAVSNLIEALELRSFGIEKPVLVLGYTPPEEAKALGDNNITQCVYSYAFATLLSANAQRSNVNVKIHLKLDTGMCRLGFDCRDDNLSGLADAVNSAKLKNLCLEGIFTHFAFSDRDSINEDGFTDRQFSLFLKACNEIKTSGFKNVTVHCCNSAALFKDCEKHIDACRPGIILYGLKPSNTEEFNKNLIPVMSFKSVVSMVKEISENDTVGYGRTFKATRKIRVATVSVGYADGYPRLLSNKGYVLIKGQKAPVIGRVCMDQMTVDVTDIPNVTIGEEVLLFGKELSVDILAELCSTINYEIVCGISDRVPRIIK